MTGYEESTLPETAAIDYLRAKQILNEYQIDGRYCFHDDTLVGSTEAAIVKRALRHIDEIEYWVEGGELKDATYGIETVVDLAQRLRGDI